MRRLHRWWMRKVKTLALFRIADVRLCAPISAVRESGGECLVLALS